MATAPTCIKCDKRFCSFQALERHGNRKILCTRILKCLKCDKVFSQSSKLERHMQRKKTCELIQGDTRQITPPNTCHFCFIKLKNKYNLESHFKVCKIKNGGMNLLFDLYTKQNDINRQQNGKIVELKQKIDNLPPPQIINKNHFNTTLNLNLCLSYDGKDHFHKIQAVLPALIKEMVDTPFLTDVPINRQIQDNVTSLIKKLYRGEDNKELHAIYVKDPDQPTDNAFVYSDGKWHIKDWENLSKRILYTIYDKADTLKLVSSKDDRLNIIKHIFFLAGIGKDAVVKMNEKEVATLYREMGDALRFDTIQLDSIEPDITIQS